MYNAKVEIGRNLISQSFVLGQDQLIVFQLKTDGLFALGIKHDFVKELNRVAVPLAQKRF